MRVFVAIICFASLSAFANTIIDTTSLESFGSGASSPAQVSDSEIILPVIPSATIQPQIFPQLNSGPTPDLNLDAFDFQSIIGQSSALGTGSLWSTPLAPLPQNSLSLITLAPQPVCPLAGERLSIVAQGLVTNYCSNLAGNSQACGTGDSPEISCRVDCGIRQSHRERILNALKDIPDDQKAQTCENQVREILREEPVSRATLTAANSALDSTRSLLQNSIQESEIDRSEITSTDHLRCLELTSVSCDEFTETALQQGDFSQLASMFSLPYASRQIPGIRVGRIRFSLPVGENCATCMRQKYRARASADQAEDYDRRVEQLKNQLIVKLATRKANEAIANYLRFVERNDFLVRFAGLPRKTCSGIQQLQRLGSSCPHAAAIAESVRDNLGVSFAGSNPSDIIREVIEQTTQRTFDRSSNVCNNQRYDFGNFQLTKLQTVGSEKFSASIWLDAQAEREISRCQNFNTSCFVNAMANSKLRSVQSNRSPGSESESQGLEDFRGELIAELSISPALRTLLSSKEGIQTYKRLPTLSEVSGIEARRAYLQEHQRLIEEAAHSDGQTTCQALESDLRLALCTNSENYARNYSSEELRSEVARLIIDEGGRPEASPDFFLNLGSSCSLLSDSGRHDSGRAASINAADRRVAPVAFSALSTPPAGFSQTNDLFANLKPEETNDIDGCGASARPTIPPVATCRNFWDQTTVYNIGLPTCGSSSSQCSGIGAFNIGCSNTAWSFSSSSYPSSAQVFQSPLNLDFSRYLPQPDFGFQTYDQSTLTIASGLELDPLTTTFVSRESSSNGSNQNPVPEVISRGSGSNETVGIETGTTGDSQVIQTNSSGAVYRTSQLFDPETSSMFSSLATTQSPNGSLHQNQPLLTQTSQPYVVMPAQQIKKVSVSPSEVTNILSQERALSNQEQQLLRRVELQETENSELRSTISQLRQELTAMANQNSSILPLLQDISKRRSQTQNSELSDSEPEDESEFQEEVPVVTESNPQVANTSRSPASINQRFQNVSGSNNRASAIQNIISNPENISGSNNPPPSAITQSPSITSPVSINPIGNQTARAAGSRLVARQFIPSTGVTQSVSSSLGPSAVTLNLQEVSPEVRTQLVIEFLDYVKDYPLYRNGDYLSESNDAIRVDVSGRELVVRLSDISDQELRRVVQDRIFVQRMTINQQLRQARLTELQRLLAEASDGL